jgi:DNA-directed RNA polymerase alpha subunit
VDRKIKKPTWAILLDGSVEQLDLGFRSLGRLRYAKVGTVNELLELSERDLLDIPRLGVTILADIKAALAKEGLTLRSPLS